MRRCASATHSSKSARRMGSGNRCRRISTFTSMMLTRSMLGRCAPGPNRNANRAMSRTASEWPGSPTRSATCGGSPSRSRRSSCAPRALLCVIRVEEERTMIRLNIAAVLLAISAPLMAQNPVPTTTTIVETDSHQVREELRSLLQKSPPQLATVLQLDPTLLSNEPYMKNYPLLSAFVAQHPEVTHNPGFFLGAPELEREGATFSAWHQMLGDAAAFLVFLVVTSVVIWLIKTVIEQRRWSRLSAIQTEVHSKLMDRFTSNEELLAYLQSPAGKKFLEAAPIPLEAGARPMSAPVGRIFWSLQTGLVMVAAGIGFDLVSLRVPAPESAALYGIGVIALMVGIALVISAGVFYALARRFGLWQA